MRDLLWDNSSVRCHYESLQGGLGIHFLPTSSRPRVREIPSLAAWVCCFLTYLAVQTSDQATRERATYGLLVVREAMRHGGRGWIDYDRLFRQQAELNSSLQWNVIHPKLQATTVLSQRILGTGLFCSVCQECDHEAHQCALAQLQLPSTRHTPTSTHPAGAALAGFVPLGTMELAFTQGPATTGMSARFASCNPIEPEIADIPQGRDKVCHRAEQHLISPGLLRSQVRPSSQEKLLRPTLALSIGLMATYSFT